MTWYAAHAVHYFRLKSGEQDSYPVWENVYLISAETPEQALAEAETLANDDTGDSDGTLTLDDKPAEMIFAGIRKLITVSHGGVMGELTSGDEITYSEFVAPDLETVKKLAAGECVQITYEE